MISQQLADYTGYVIGAFFLIWFLFYLGRTFASWVLDTMR